MPHCGEFEGNLKVLKNLFCLGLIALGLSGCLKMKNGLLGGGSSESGSSSTAAGEGAGGSYQPISSASLVDPLAVGEASGTPFNQNQNYVQVGARLSDFTADSNGFSQWGRIYGAQTSFAPYLCRNGYLQKFRDCLDAGTPGKCIGAIKMTEACSNFGIEAERFSGWTAWQADPTSPCDSTGKRYFFRTCVNLTSSANGETRAPLCYGASRAQFSCTSDPNSMATSPALKFRVNGACTAYPDGMLLTEYREGCGGIHQFYSGTMTIQDGCYFPAGAASGSQPVCTGNSSVEKCFVSITSCSKSGYPSGVAASPRWRTSEGDYCGVKSATSTTGTSPLTAWESGYTPEINGCVAGKKTERRSCLPQSSISSSCILGLNELKNGEQFDTTCSNGQILKQISSCTPSTSLSLKKDGVWGDWYPSTGCIWNPAAQKFMRLETRVCDKVLPSGTGSFCAGEKTRQVDCGQSPLQGNRLAILLSQSLSAETDILATVNSYAQKVRSKGADVDVIIQNPSMSVAALRNLIQGLTLSSGQKPNSVLIIGGFPHARVDGKNASRTQTLIYSDLPYEAGTNHYYETSAGVFKVNPTAAGTPMNLQRVVFWIDFTTHTITSAQYPSVVSKYRAFLNKMLAYQNSVNDQVANTWKPTLNMFVDDYWSNQPHEVSSNIVNTDYQGRSRIYIGTSRSGHSAFLELASIPSDMFISMAHANSSAMDFGFKSYLPGNDSVYSPINSVSTDGSKSFFSGVPIKAGHVNAFNCYAGDPSGVNNLAGSILLNPEGLVKSGVFSTTSGALSSWNGYKYNNALGLGHTAATAFLVWTRGNHYDGPSIHFNRTPEGDMIEDLGLEWSTGLIKVGDPLWRNGQ
jgi:hypothetical protein